MDKNEALDLFASEFKPLSDPQKEEFARIVSKFLNETFILKNKAHDQADYFFVLEYQSLFRSYFALTDYELVFDQERSYFSIATQEARSRVKLNKFETVLLLLLRLAYYENAKTAGRPEDNAIKLDELIRQVNNTNIFHPEKKMTEYDLALKKLRRCKVIDFKGSKLQSGIALVILPTILSVLSQTDIDLIAEQLQAFAKGKGEADENAD